MALSKVHEALLEVLRRHPNGITLADMRPLMRVGGTQQDLPKRLRELRDMGFEMTCVARVYTLISEPAVIREVRKIPGPLRAQILLNAACGMCGRTVAAHGILMEVDHKIPLEWGGTDDRENLWALCQQCNNGKRNYFANFDNEEMRELKDIENVHQRLHRLFQLHLNEALDPMLLEAVASLKTYQDDWKKRVRELRYKGIEMNIQVTRRLENGKMIARYAMTEDRPLPENFAQIIAERNSGRHKNRGDNDFEGDDLSEPHGTLDL